MSLKELSLRLLSALYELIFKEKMDDQALTFILILVRGDWRAGRSAVRVCLQYHCGTDIGAKQFWCSCSYYHSVQYPHPLNAG